MSPTTNTFGWPGIDRSGSTLTRPARSSSTSDWSARSRPSGLADTPADHTLVADSMRRMVPSESFTVMPLRSTSVTMAPSWISTPIFSSRACALLPSFSPIGGSTAGAASSRITRACVESMWRNAPLSVWSASSAIWPGHLDAGGSGADDGERQQLLAARRITGPLGLLERTEDPPAQLQCVVDRSSCPAPTRRSGHCRSRTGPPRPRRSACRTGSRTCGPAAPT